MSKLNCLLKQPAEQWTIDQVIVFDWSDGPRQGIASLKQPNCEFSFDLIAEIPRLDELDDRYFSLKDIPLGAVKSVIELLRPLGEPTSSVWVPNWQFADESDQIAADQRIDDLLVKAIPSSIVVHAQDMSGFLGCWDMTAETPRLPEPLVTIHQPELPTV